MYCIMTCDKYTSFIQRYVSYMINFWIRPCINLRSKTEVTDFYTTKIVLSIFE